MLSERLSDPFSGSRSSLVAPDQVSTGVATMLVQIDENSATLTPFSSLARHIHPDAPTVETKSWSELLRLVLSQTIQKRSHENPAEPDVRFTSGR